MQERKRVTKIIVGILVIIALSIGGKHYMDRQREDGLYRHAFSLLEEKIASYIVENYAGVSKVEFSPIYVVETDMYNMGSIAVVPVIYDEHGNSAFLGGKVKNVIFSDFGFPGDISSLDFDYKGDHSIYLINSKNGEEIDVSDFKKLPEEAKITDTIGIDDNILLLVEDEQLQGVVKDKAGSPKAEIIYNLEIIRGEVEDRWR